MCVEFWHQCIMWPAFSSNIYEYQINGEELNKLKVLVVNSGSLKSSLSWVLVKLRGLIEEKWQGKAFAHIEGKHLVALTPSDRAASELAEIIRGYLREGVAPSLEPYPFTKVQQKLGPVIYAALAKALFHHTLLSLNREGWTPIDRGRVYTRNYSDFIVDLPSPIGEYVGLYRGAEIATLPLELYDVFDKRFPSLGLCIDYAVILEPLKTLQELIDEGLKYNERRLMLKEEKRDEQFGYTTVRYETWDIDELMMRTAKVHKFSKRGDGSWELESKEVELKNAYPIRRAEVIDRMLRSKHELREGLTSIVKRESFQITSEGRRNEHAPRHRLEATKRIQRALAQAVSRHAFLGELKVALSEEPLTIEMSSA